MEYFRKLRVKNSYSFDIRNFILKQDAISNKFPCPAKELFQIYDNFFGNISEEIYEYNEEKKNLSNLIYNEDKFLNCLENKNYEAVDIIMYMGSLISSVIDYFKLDINKVIDIYEYLFKSFIFTKNVMSESEIFENVYHQLSFIRRKIPNRKYHKRETFIDKDLELNTIENEEVLKLLFTVLRDTLFGLFNIIMNEYEYYYESNILIVNALFQKQDKVLSHSK